MAHCPNSISLNCTKSQALQLVNSFFKLHIQIKYRRRVGGIIDFKYVCCMGGKCYTPHSMMEYSKVLDPNYVYLRFYGQYKAKLLKAGINSQSLNIKFGLDRQFHL